MDTVGNVLERTERPAYVQFERRPIEDKAASLEQGRFVAKDVDFALVTPPYSKDQVVSRIDRWKENLENNVRLGKIPKEWRDHYLKAYDAWKNGQELPLNGTPIKGWGMISPAQQEMLVHIKVLTVEDLAGINEEGQRRIGMGALDLKNKAVAWVSQNKDKGPLTQEVALLKNENAQLKASLDALQKQVERMSSQPLTAQPQTIESGTNGISSTDILDEPTPDIYKEYELKFGKKPHHKMKTETIEAALK